MFSWFASDNIRIYQKLGYFADQQGIMNRYIRESENWSSHLQNTKSAILKSCSNKGSNKIAILGSGWLLDVPIEELSRLFKEVWLFDIKHPAQIKRRMEKLGNIHFIETDISGFARSTFTASRSKNVVVDSLKPQFDYNLKDYDLVVSCNILNQLDIILVDYLKKTLRIDHNTEMRMRRLIQETHLNLLPLHKSLIISDIEELLIDKQNQVVKRKSLVYTDKLSTNTDDKWIWRFDNCCSYNKDYNTWLNVISRNV